MLLVVHTAPLRHERGGQPLGVSSDQQPLRR